MKITLFRTSFWRAKAGTVKCKNCIRNLEKALDKTGKVGYTNQAVSGKRKQISGCSAVLVARLNGVQEGDTIDEYESCIWNIKYIEAGD